jgi:hypothetical protein
MLGSVPSMLGTSLQWPLTRLPSLFSQRRDRAGFHRPMMV